VFKVSETGIGIVRENANFRGSETDFPRRKRKKEKIHGEKKSAVQKNKNKIKGNKMKKKHRF